MYDFLINQSLSKFMADVEVPNDRLVRWHKLTPVALTILYSKMRK